MKKQMKLFGMIVGFVLSMILSCHIYASEYEKIQFTNVSPGMVIYTGEKKKIEVNVPDIYVNEVIKYKSSNPKVGTISKKGVFRAKKVGKTTIRAYIPGTKQSVKVRVNVKKLVKTQKLSLNNVEKILGVGSSLSLRSEIYPSNATYQKVKWKSSKPRVATISANGKIKARKPGKTKITAYIENTKLSVSFVLRVKKAVKLQAIEIKETATTLETGDKVQLSVQRVPENTTDIRVKWKSSNERVATVSSTGQVTALKEGKTTITVRAVGTAKKDKITINVVPPYVETTGIVFTNQNVNEVEFGTQAQFFAKVLPDNATNKNIKWSTSDTTKAVITADGVLTALRPTEYVQVIAQTNDRKYKVSHTIQISAKKKGFLKKSDLDVLDLSAVNKLMIVSHPDDETLWGGAHLLEDDYFVVCLSHGWNNIRKNDFYEVMDYTNEKRLILSYPDTKREYWKGNVWTYDTDTMSTCISGIKKDLELILNYKDWDVVVTHNPNGEYVKYGHMKVSDIVTEVFNKTVKNKSELYYFGRYYNKNVEIPGNQISKELLEIKNHLVNMYLPTAKGAINAFGHMIPYENWIPVEQW